MEKSHFLRYTHTHLRLLYNKIIITLKFERKCIPSLVVFPTPPTKILLKEKKNNSINGFRNIILQWLINMTSRNNKILIFLSKIAYPTLKTFFKQFCLNSNNLRKRNPS